MHAGPLGNQKRRHIYGAMTITGLESGSMLNRVASSQPVLSLTPSGRGQNIPIRQGTVVTRK